MYHVPYRSLRFKYLYGKSWLSGRDPMNMVYMVLNKWAITCALGWCLHMCPKRHEHKTSSIACKTIKHVYKQYYIYTYTYIYNIYICTHSILYYNYIIVQISVSQSLSLSLPVELCRSSYNSWLVAPKMGIIWHMLKPPGQIVCQRRCPILVHAPQAAWEGRALLLDDSSLSWQARWGVNRSTRSQKHQLIWVTSPGWVQKREGLETVKPAPCEELQIN